MGLFSVFGPKTYGVKSQRLVLADKKRAEKKKRQELKPRQRYALQEGPKRD